MTSQILRDVFIVAGARTPMGGFNGELSSMSAVDLGIKAVKAALGKCGISAASVEELILGNVYGANEGQNPAKQVALGSGCSHSTNAYSLNKACASGLKAVQLAAESIQLGRCQVAVAAGTESMTNVPHYIPQFRGGVRYGDGKIVEGLQRDGLYDAYEHYAMGIAAEACAKEFDLSRSQQDEYAAMSYTRSSGAAKAGLFQREVVPIEVSQGRGKPSVTVDTDEEITRCDLARIPKARPAFKDDGTVTGPNSSTLSDGAAAVVLVSGEMLSRINVVSQMPVVKYIAAADGSQEPVRFTTAPAVAIPSALSRAGRSLEEVDFFEINEAFSVVALANMKRLQLDPERVNVRGGAVSMGHPLGCSGTRILVTLMHILADTNRSLGVAAICNGGGGATAVVVERVDATAMRGRL